MMKKILIAVVVLGVVAVAVIGFGTYKVADKVLKDKEPQLRQYIQLDEDAQNKYIIDNFDELLSNVDLDKDGEPEDKEELERFKELNSQPDIQKALIQVGRSVIATGIIMSDSIVNDMSDDLKAKYQKESEELDSRADRYNKLIEAADPTLK